MPAHWKEFHLERIRLKMINDRFSFESEIYEYPISSMKLIENGVRKREKKRKSEREGFDGELNRLLFVI